MPRVQSVTNLRRDIAVEQSRLRSMEVRRDRTDSAIRASQQKIAEMQKELEKLERGPHPQIKVGVRNGKVTMSDGGHAWHMTPSEASALGLRLLNSADQAQNEEEVDDDDF